MSGEATSQRTAAPEALERAFGTQAVCNRCAAPVADYRIVALFLHQTAALRAYCRECYGQVEGEYHAAGDGVLMSYDEFARRFGAPGPIPPPATPVDRILARFMADPDLRRLVPPSEALAKRTQVTPYQFDVGLQLGAEVRAAMLALAPDGSVASLQGEPMVCERVRAILAGR